jgi:hypothetical protein
MRFGSFMIVLAIQVRFGAKQVTHLPGLESEALGVAMVVSWEGGF